MSREWRNVGNARQWSMWGRLCGFESNLPTTGALPLIQRQGHHARSVGSDVENRDVRRVNPADS